MSHEMVAEVAFTALMIVVVGGLVLYLLIALYRERKAGKTSRETLAGPPPAE